MRDSLNDSDQIPKIKLRVTRKVREVVMGECFSIVSFGFISFSLFRIKHNCTKDFCEVSASLASNAAFPNTCFSCCFSKCWAAHQCHKYEALGWICWDTGSVGISTGAGILGAICRKGNVCLYVPEGLTKAMCNYREYITSIAKEGRATETSSNGVACLSASSINS